MASNKPVIHGRDHRTGGSDPIFAADSDAIRFAVDNVGTWLDVHTTSTDGGGLGMFFRDTGSGGIELNSTGSVAMVGVGGFITSTGGITLANSTAGDIDLTQTSGADVNITTSGSGDIFMQTTTGLATLVSGGNLLLGGGNVQVSIPAGGKFYIEFGSGNVFEVRSDGTTHTQGAVVADL